MAGSATRAALVILLLAAGYLTFLHALGDTGLVDETEPIFAESARQMVETGDWVTPSFNGAPRFDKPPLTYWLVASLYGLVGVSELAARLPSALSALAVAGMIFVAVLALAPPSGDAGRWGGALVAALAFLLAPEAWVWGRTGVSDMLLTACLTGALLAFFAACARSAPGWFIVSAALCGAATLAKGPVAPALLALVGLSLLAWSGRLREMWRTMPVITTALVFLAVVAPWHILVTMANGRSFIDAFFGYHNVQRYLSVVNRHAGPWWFYLPVLAVGFLPWSVLLVRAVAAERPWDRTRWRNQPPAAQLGLFACVWLAVVFAFFTVAQTKLPSYLLPALPAAAILVGLAWTHTLHKEVSRRTGAGLGVWLEGVAVTAVCAGLAAACWLLPGTLAAAGDPDLPAIGLQIGSAGLPVRGALIWSIAAVAAAACVAARRASRLPLVLAAAMLAFFAAVLLPALSIGDTVRQQPLRALAATARVESAPDEPLLMIGFWKPSLTFYARRRVVFAPSLEAGLTYLAGHRAAPVLVVADERLWRGELPPHELVRHSGRYHLLRVLPW